MKPVRPAKRLWAAVGLSAALLTGCASVSSHARPGASPLQGAVPSRGANPSRGAVPSRGAARPGAAGPSQGANPSVTDLRAKAIREAVTAWAIQNAVYHWMRQEHAALRAKASRLDQIFDFRALLIDGRITPPVITQANNTFNLINSDLATQTVTEYRIRAPSRIVSVPPSWRDYLLQPVPKPHPLSTLLSPRNRAERLIWRRAETQGRRWGIEQAKRVMAADFARLRRNYTGMVRARILMRQHVLSTPVLARTSQGVRIQGHTLAVGAIILRITHHSEYNRSTEWKAIPSKWTAPSTETSR